LSFIFYLPHTFYQKRDIKPLIQILAAFVIFQAIWVSLQRLRGGPLGLDLEVYLPGQEFGVRARENIDIYRSSGTFFEPSILGTFMLMHFFFFLSLYFKNDDSTKGLKGIIVMAITASLISIVFTASRGIYFLLIALGIIFVLLTKRLRGFSLPNMMRAIKRLLVIVAVIILVSTPFIVKRLESTGTLFSATGSATSRIQLNQYAIRLAQANPFGVGLNLSPYFFATAFPQETFTFDPSRPHNIFFQVLAETGFFGLVLFALFIYYALRSYLVSKEKLSNLEFFMASLAFLAGAQIYPIFTNHPEILSFFFLYLGYIVFGDRRKSYGEK
jgi:O-antigen ligase